MKPKPQALRRSSEEIYGYYGSLEHNFRHKVGSLVLTVDCQEYSSSGCHQGQRERALERLTSAKCAVPC